MIFVSLNSLANYYFRSIKEKYFLEKIENNFIKEQKIIKTIILGDSHVLRSIDPKLIPDSYNYSSHAENYVHIYYRLKKHLANNDLALLQTAVLQMDPHCFTRKFNEQQYLPFIKIFIDPYELGKDLKKPIFYVLYYKLVAGFADYFGGLRIYLDSLFWDYSDKDTYKGYEALTYNQEHCKKILNETIDYHFRYSEIFPEMKLYFEKIIKLLQSRNIKVILLTYPMCRPYLRGIPIETVNGFLQYREWLMEQNENIIVLDYHNMFLKEEGNTGAFFADFNHLNEKGSQMVSQKLHEDLLRLN